MADQRALGTLPVPGFQDLFKSSRKIYMLLEAGGQLQTMSYTYRAQVCAVPWVCRGIDLHIMAICLNRISAFSVPLAGKSSQPPLSFFPSVKHPLNLQTSGKYAFFEKPSWPWSCCLRYLLSPCPDTCLLWPSTACNYAFICVILSFPLPRS